MFGLKKQIQNLKADFEKANERIADLEKQAVSLRLTLESMVEGVITLAKDTRITSLNSSAQKIFGISAKDAGGKFFLEAIPNNDIAELVNKVLETQKFISQEISLVWPIRKIFQVNATPLSENDKISGCLLVVHDITELRKLEAVRRDFVANVSHELKTPLTAIKGFVETLLEGALDDKENGRHFVNIIQDHANRLNDLINDLLDLSHIESKNIKLEFSDCNLKDLTDKVLSGFKSQLKKKSIETRNDLPEGILIKADKSKIEQVLTNLIDNAIKFNKEKGSIKIYSQGSDALVKIMVEDSGIGIPEKDLPRIFERFYRVDKARSREMGGTGLGLSIVKHIAELHAGSVGVESTEGLGSKFWFTLPK